VPAAYNVPTGGIRHPWLTLRLMQLVASYDKTVPLNYGLFENITVSVPKGSLLNPEFPAAVGIRSAPAIRVNDVLTGCIARAIPELIPAPSGGTVVPVVLAEHDPSLGTRRVHVMQSLVGGTGARKGADGVDGRDSSLANCFNTPSECTEAEAGVVIETYALRPDSGGAGEWRGGTGLLFTVRVLRPGSAVLGRGLERYVFRPWGLAGGMPGWPARVVENLGTPGERELGKIAMIEPRAGDTVTLMSAGGGGYGDPCARDPARVLADVRAGFVSVEAARRDYGVAIKGGAIDEATTRDLRAAPRRRPAIDFGPERTAWEEVFDDASMTELAALLLRWPAALRTKLRQRLFGEVVPALDQIGHRPMAAVLGDPAEARQRLQQAMKRVRTGAGD
jgi:N-methylhydantoinase B